MDRQRGFLPTNKNEMKERGWEQADFVYISGDAEQQNLKLPGCIIYETVSPDTVYN